MAAYVRTSTGGVTQNSITVLVDGLSYPASSYNTINIYGAGESSPRSVNYGGGANGDGTYRSATTTFSGLQAGKQYSFYARAIKNSGGQTVSIPTIYVTTNSPPAPSSPSFGSISVDGKNITVRVTAGANTTALHCTLGGNPKGPIYCSPYQTVSFYFTVSQFDTRYSVSAYGTNGTGSSSTIYTSVMSGADNIPPKISINSSNGLNNITVGWSAYDDTALRPSNTFGCWISGADNTSLSFVTYVGQNTSSYTFTKDGNGRPFKVNSKYLVRIIAYDAKNNSAYSDRYVTYTKSRPSNFNWDAAKVQGGNFNITASEWNRLQNKVNEFRIYKGLAELTTLTNVSKDDTFTAEHFNKIVRALNTLSPSMSPPSQVSVGDDITASGINLLRNSLNSIS